MHRKLHALFILLLVLPIAVSGCQKRKKEKKNDKPTTKKVAGEELKIGHGVDAKKKTIHVGVLTAQQGPAAEIGEPFLVGSMIVKRLIEAKDSKLLPDGWKFELKVANHSYNPAEAVREFDDMHHHVLFVGTSLGTPPTTRLMPKFEEHHILAFPASLYSGLAEFEYTPPIGPSYKLESMRAFEWAAEQATQQDESLEPAIVWQFDEYGRDSLHGWEKAAKASGHKLVAKPHVKPGQTTAKEVVKKLEEAGANYVMLGVLPATTSAVLQEAKEQDYNPVWIGNTAAWADKFMQSEDIPADLFADFYWATGFPYWGEDVPGMSKFEQAFKKHIIEKVDPNFYVLLGYIQGLLEVEVVKRAIEEEDALTREALLRALHSIEEWDAGGLLHTPVDFSETPYVTGTEVRILKPVFDQKSWAVVGEWATPEAMGADVKDKREAIE